MAKRKTPREILEAAAPDAARVISAAVTDETLSPKERYNAACEVLGRLYGRSMEPEEKEAPAIQVMFLGEGEEMAE